MIPVLENENFWEWFGESKVVDEDGDPRVVYHATTHHFKVFKPDKQNVEADLGAAYYFSSNPEDSGKNYTTYGIDLINRIGRLAEKIADQMLDDPESFGIEDGVSDEEIELLASRAAAKELSGGKDLVMPVYLSLQNPLILGGDDETILTWKQGYDSYGDPTDVPTGTLVEFLDNLEEVIEPFYDGNIDKVREDVAENLFPEDGGAVTASELIDTLKGSDGLMYAQDYELDDAPMVSSELIRQAFEATGFDGVIDHTVYQKFGPRRLGAFYVAGMPGLTPDTTHYLAFKPTQIKSAIANDGSYDFDDPDITSNP